MHISAQCEICGTSVETRVPDGWSKARLRRGAADDMQAHLATHSFAELLRFEIRKDPLQLPEEQRLTIVRDVYQHLLGEVNGEEFTLGEHDSHGVYSIAEALGSASIYRLWSESCQCFLPTCACRRGARQPEPLTPGP